MTTTPGIGHNNPPVTANDIFEEIIDLYEEAKNWADGEPIMSTEMHDAVTKLHDDLHDAGKRLDGFRKEEKKPLDKQVKAIQKRYNPYIQPKRGKVDMGKSTLADLLAPWRAEVIRKKEAAAAKAREEADVKARAAEEALRASTGNLVEREKAELLLKEAKKDDRIAKRVDKAATTGTGLRTVWAATLTDRSAALDWAFDRDPRQFMEVAQQLANEAVRSGVRTIPGFEITESKVAR